MSETPITDSLAFCVGKNNLHPDTVVVAANDARNLERSNVLLREVLVRAVRFVDAFEPQSRSAEIAKQELLRSARDILKK